VALSYVCGDPKDTKEVIIDGESLYVYSNLDNALRHLRKPDAELVLWADALCIHQNNNDEKLAQVGILSKIYGDAHHVIGWLGPADDSKSSALKVPQHLGHEPTQSRLSDLNHLMEDFRYPQPPGPTLAQKIRARWLSACISQCVERTALSRTCSNLVRNPFTPGTQCEMLRNGRRKMSTQHILGRSNSECIEAFLSHEYFTRIWIYQEIILARQLVLACGELRFDREAVLWGVVGVSSCYGHDNYRGGLTAVIELLIGFLALAVMRDEIENRRPFESAHIHEYRTKSLLWSMGGLRYGRCTDPRDRIFALVPICADPLAKSNSADYTLSTVQVAKRLTRTYIKEKGTLKIFDFCGWQSSPSWTIDLKAPSNDYMVFEMGKGSVSGTNYSAATRTPATVIIDDEELDSNVLKLRGIRIDSIRQLGSRCEGFLHHKMSPLLQEWWDLARTVKATEFDFWMAITAKPRAAFDTESGWKIHERKIEEWLKSKATEFSGSSFTSVWGNELIVFFITDAGRMGFCRRGARVGDQVCLLYGGPTPYVLRPIATTAAETHYRLIRPCYIHGVMEGELMEGIEQGQFEEETFALV
jgi:Heterokaryon incompatibility protein (HET)